MQLKKFTSTNYGKTIMVALGAALYAGGVAVFITPLNLFAGGAMGFAQLLRSIIIDIFKLPVSESIDLAGIIYYIINIPLMIIAYKRISRLFFYRTVVGITVITVITSLIKISSPVVSDTLTCCITGGIISGVGVGIMLMFGGSGGGMDIVGMYMSKVRSGASVGKVALFFNFLLYSICAFMFNIETAVYSIIFTAVVSLATDKMHYQNIMVQVMIFTKKEDVATPIMTELGRGVTEWQGDGAYTKEGTHILVSLVSKYEINRVSKMVRDIDPNAFIIYNNVSRVDGNFIKKLQA